MSVARILIVDDDPPIRRLTGAVLRRAGHSVEEARNGVEAVHLIEQFDFDVVLLDLMMPTMNGFELIEWLRTRAPKLLPCTIVMTAAADRDLVRLQSEDVFRVIRKPFDLNDLVDSVQRCAMLKTEAPSAE